MDLQVWSFIKLPVPEKCSRLNDQAPPQELGHPFDPPILVRTYDTHLLDRVMRRLVPEAEFAGAGHFVFGLRTREWNHPGVIIQVYNWSHIESYTKDLPGHFVTVRVIPAAPLVMEDNTFAQECCNRWNADVHGPCAAIDEVEFLGEKYPGVVLNAHLNVSDGIHEELLVGFIRDAIDGAMAFWGWFLEQHETKG